MECVALLYGTQITRTLYFVSNYIYKTYKSHLVKKKKKKKRKRHTIVPIAISLSLLPSLNRYRRFATSLPFPFDVLQSHKIPKPVHNSWFAGSTRLQEPKVYRGFLNPWISKVVKRIRILGHKNLPCQQTNRDPLSSFLSLSLSLSKKSRDPPVKLSENH